MNLGKDHTDALKEVFKPTEAHILLAADVQNQTGYDVRPIRAGLAAYNRAKNVHFCTFDIGMIRENIKDEALIWGCADNIQRGPFQNAQDCQFWPLNPEKSMLSPREPQNLSELVEYAKKHAYSGGAMPVVPSDYEALKGERARANSLADQCQVLRDENTRLKAELYDAKRGKR